MGIDIVYLGPMHLSYLIVLVISCLKHLLAVIIAGRLNVRGKSFFSTSSQCCRWVSMQAVPMAAVLVSCRKGLPLLEKEYH